MVLMLLTFFYFAPPPFHPLVAGADPSGAIRVAVPSLRRPRPRFGPFVCGILRPPMPPPPPDEIRQSACRACVRVAVVAAAAAQHGRFNLGYAYMCPPSPLAPSLPPSHAIAH